MAPPYSLGGGAGSGAGASTSSSSTSSSATALMVGMATAVASTAAAAFAAWEFARRKHQREREALLEDWQSRRQQERTGRIRAEVQLRALRKEHQLLLLGSQSAPAAHATISKAKDGAATATDPSSRLLLTAIGTVVSPFVKRMGTPRQPQLAPSARGYLHLNHVPPPCLDGLKEYSHAWILFAFHANTDDHRASNKRRTKIRPPRAPANVKVGQLATRSPHRPNPIGLSLVRIEQWDAATRRLHVTGLDLVHGTPIFDIKPCVPWDIPGYYDCQRRAGVGAVATTSSDDAHATRHVSQLLLEHWKSVLRVPDWVSNDTDQLCGVEFVPSALEQLDTCVARGLLAPLYATHNGGGPAAAQTLREILLQDPRSSHTVGSSGSGSNGGSTTSNGRRNNRNRDGGGIDDDPSAAPSAVEPYRLLFGRCRVDFVVRERRVTVEAVVPAAIDGTDGSPNGEGVPPFVAEGIPLLMSNHPPPRKNGNNDVGNEYEMESGELPLSRLISHRH